MVLWWHLDTSILIVRTNLFKLGYKQPLIRIQTDNYIATEIMNRTITPKQSLAMVTFFLEKNLYILGSR